MAMREPPRPLVQVWDGSEPSLPTLHSTKRLSGRLSAPVESTGRTDARADARTSVRRRRDTDVRTDAHMGTPVRTSAHGRPVLRRDPSRDTLLEMALEAPREGVS